MFTVDLSEVRRLHEAWIATFPTIAPFFAVKCNPDLRVIRVLHEMGVGFDCASKTELALVAHMSTKELPTKERIIYANTCKLPKDLEYARSLGVVLMTLDNVYEVRKIARHCPEAEVVLRMFSGNPNAIIPFGDKFGALDDEWDAILTECEKAGLRVRGVSFHVGSGCSDGAAYVEAIRRAHKCLAFMRGRGHAPDILDIGGGFSHPIADSVARAIHETLAEVDTPVTVIAEPGRYFVETAFTLRAPVIGKRIRGDHWSYWIQESIYGSFADVAHGYLTPTPCVDGALTDASLRKTTIYGATCDGSDIIVKDALLPELEIGDWITFPNMGAYTSVLSTRFNGMKWGISGLGEASGRYATSASASRPGFPTAPF